MNREGLSLLALALYCGPGSTVPSRLLDIYGALEPVWEETPFSLSFRTGLREERAGFLERREALFDAAQRHLERVGAVGARILLLTDPDYPSLLKHIHAPPALLYCLGDPACLSRDCLGVVGTRHASAEGMVSARRIARFEAEQGVVVVSGLARGIDAAAHRGALDAGYGKTAAVLGCGIDVVYPAAHRGLIEEIRKRGVVLSEIPPGQEPRKHYFPMRNRIISGLSRRVLVVEAPVRSGALITSQTALDQGREVLVCGWEKETVRNGGVFRLQEEGASLYRPPVRSRVDLSSIDSGFSGESGQILKLLDEAPATINAVLASLQCGVERLLPLLVRLELQGLIVFRRGSWWLSSAQTF